MKKLLIIIILALTTNAYSADWGKFSGPLRVEFLHSKHDVKLLRDFAYTGPGPEKAFWFAPKGTVTDGASIPQIAWSVVGGPLDGQYRNAAVIHDVACVNKKRSWQQTHMAFYTAMRAAGVDITTAKTMYAAVYHFGPRWAEPTHILLPRTKSKLITSKLEEFNADLPAGKKAILIDEGRTISRNISTGFLKSEQVDEVVGAVIEVQEQQPQPSKEAFEKMRQEIKEKNLSLSQIEQLPVAR
ncbi:DUF1353 domain-containing protein [Pseudomonas jessenii]|jgi:hypothetical protein|nr:DUF1353 domain-containing protein [Pseudomonas asplenii]PNG45394.1 hypothetical protein A1354_00655 [Pseudomonas asplenii]PYC19141.1 DUF1353 domain-containing protein [Pseudomonas jessenii]